MLLYGQCFGESERKGGLCSFRRTGTVSLEAVFIKKGKIVVAEVIVDIAHSDVDKIFDYLCGEEITAGMRVAVPFGRSAATGFVGSIIFRGAGRALRVRLPKKWNFRPRRRNC